MKGYIPRALFFAIISSVIVIPVYAQVFTVNDAEKPTYLFVLSGTSGEMKGDTLTLNGVPNLVYFSDRPSRIAGHKSLSDIAGLWDKVPDSFKADPPNATFSILGKDGAVNSVLELISAEANGSSVSFKIRVLEGSPPERFGAASLFVENFCPWCF